MSLPAEFPSFALVEAFRCTETSFTIRTGVRIEFLEHPPSPTGYAPAQHIADFYRMRLSQPQYWLHVEPSGGLNPSEATNLALLALWVARPSKTHVPIRLDPAKPVLILDRFHWVGSPAEDPFSREDLTGAFNYFCALEKSYKRRRRLANAVALSFQGCTNHYWHAAYICFAAAFETLLSYSEGPGLTKRLAKSFACLVGEKKDERDARYREFVNLYNVRSDIVHGRAHEHHESSENLGNLAIFSNQLRLVWQRVLGDAGIQEILEQEDRARKIWFMSRERGYTPPADDN